MITINPYCEKENLSDENVLRILKDVCKARNSEKVSELRKLMAILEGEND